MINEYNEFERICKKAAVTKFQLLSKHLPGETDENHEKPQSEYPVSGLRFEPELSGLLSGSANVKKCPAFSGTRKLINVFTYLIAGPYPERDEFNPPPHTVLRAILILSFLKCLGLYLPSGIFPSGFPNNISFAFFLLLLSKLLL
jgi:hypothetical protein